MSIHDIIEWYPTIKDLQLVYKDLSIIIDMVSLIHMPPKFHFITNSQFGTHWQISYIYIKLTATLFFHMTLTLITTSLPQQIILDSAKTLPPITFHHGSLCRCYFILNDIFKQCLLATFTWLLAKFKVQVYELLQRFYKPLGPSASKTRTKCINNLAW